MALSQLEIQSIIQLVRRDPEVRRQLQDALQLNGLLEVPTRMDRVEATLEKVAELQRRSEERFSRVEKRLEGVEARLERVENRLESVEARLERVENRLESVEARLERAENRLEGVEARLGRLEEAVAQLVEIQRRSEDRLSRVEAAIGQLVEAQQRTEVEVTKISDRLRGEEGRRTGEQYERTIERRAPFLLGGGAGGSAQRDAVYSRVQHLLAPLYRTDDLSPEADPMLADILWWKENRYVVVEVSVRVDRLDVLRAAQRAQSLRKAGVDATGVVIGDEWLAEDTLALAEDEAVEWKIGNAYSPGLIEYRRIAA